MKQKPVLLFFVILLAMGSGCESPSSSGIYTTPNYQKEAPSKTISSEYILGTGDILELSFFRKPPKLQKEYRIHIADRIKIEFTYYSKLNTEIIVPPDGKINLKKIGEIKIYNLTTSELTTILKDAYSKTLTRPDVVVKLVKHYSPATEYFSALKLEFGGQNTLVSIRSDGKITLPVIKTIQAEGLTPSDFRNNLQEKFNRLIPGIEVSVNVTEEGSKKILVLGEVKNSGIYQLRSWTTLLDSITLSGGYTDRANLDEVIVIRKKDRDTSKTILLNVDELLSKRNTLRRFYLKPYDIVYVPKKGIVDLGIALNDIYNLVPRWVALGFGYSLGG